MNKFRFAIKILAIAIFTFAFATLASAQATRTWVSGVGDDANPCSRTAPCKTFAGAISKTFINGEIDCLDEGGFGAVTVTKSITLDGTYGGGFGSILASGTTGVIINVAVSGNDPLATVKLRNLDITGIGASGSVGTRTGTFGIRVLNAKGVIIEHCLVTDFSNRGLSDERNVAGALTVADSTFRNTTGSAVVVIPGAAGSVDATFSNCNFTGNTSAGLGAEARTKITCFNCVASGNGGRGFVAEGDATPQLNLQNCIASHNGTGVAATNGALVRISNTQITNNTSFGIDAQSGGLVSSFLNNNIVGNGGGVAGNSPNGPPIGQQ